MRAEADAGPRSAGRRRTPADRKELREKVQKIRKEAVDKSLEVLTSEQRRSSRSSAASPSSLIFPPMQRQRPRATDNPPRERSDW